MKLIRFFFLLIVLFFIAFFFSGGIRILDPQTISNIKATVSDLRGESKSGTSSSAKLENSSAEKSSGDSTLDRVGRFIFLKDSVDRRVAEVVSKKDYVTIDKIPDNLKQAIVAVEDNRFYSHHGFDIEGIARASLVNLQYGRIEEGASTITQQLVKNLFLTQDQTFDRKAEELLLALDMEARYSKDEILELYLNTIYFGSNYYGIRQASIGYFGKEPSKLILPESAMIAGLPNAPSLYSPYVDFMMSKKRQIIVLDSMVRTGVITKETAEDAKIKPIYLAH